MGRALVELVVGLAWFGGGLHRRPTSKCSVGCDMDWLGFQFYTLFSRVAFYGESWTCGIAGTIEWKWAYE